MSHPDPFRNAQPNPASLGTSREREFYKYLPPHHFNAQTLQHVGQATSTEFVARSSDPVLIAFAQLGTFRLDAQHTLISLFGRHEQHVLTEATRTLSLQGNPDNNACDALWFGSCTMSYERSFCKSVLNASTSAQTTSDRVVIVPDLLLDDRFKEHPDVTGRPNIRFLACSPIISPKGFVIGSYTILDNKPHGPPNIDQIKFLADIATTVMDYLDTIRSQAQRLRGERMIVGLGSFLEGKGGLRNSWLSETDDLPSLCINRDHAEGDINREQQEKQVMDDVIQAMTPSSASSDLPLRSHPFHTRERRETDRRKLQTQLLASSKARKSDYLNRNTANQHATNATMTADNMGTKEQSPKECYTTQVKEAFSRAANLIRESAELEAIVFFDADFRSGEALVDNAQSDRESSGLESCSSSDEKGQARRTLTHHESFTTQVEGTGKTTLNPCGILGFATSNSASVNNELATDSEISLSESFLRDLLRRYPRGKIFNYGEDGSISSDDSSDGMFNSFNQRSGGKTYKRTKKIILRQDAASLLRLVPDARSIAFSPLWDLHKERWYSGSLAWTKAPHRAFTSDSDLSFIFTFGNSLMAEVHRLGAQFAERAKSDLLAGLSHELRSPLHGIFGTAELLDDTIMDSLQRGYVHTISSCAFTLLGSINQLLEYAGINDVGPNSGIAKRLGGIGHKSPIDGTLASAGQDHESGDVDPESLVELDVVLEDTLESVFAGYTFADSSRSPLRGVTGASRGSNPFNMQSNEVKVILDIDHSQSWVFSIRPEALRVILTNTLGNALKFTQRGYIYVSLKAVPLNFEEDGKVTRSKVMVSVRDTGCGIDQEFLTNGVFSAFSQEDVLTSGNGLGLNIVRRVVSSLGGDIQINSQKDVGTEVLTTMILDHISQNIADRNSLDTVTATKTLVRERTIGILGLGLSELDRILGLSLQKLCRDWFCMDVCLDVPSEPQFSQCEIYIAPQEFLDMGNMEVKPIAPDLKRLSSPVIVMCSSPQLAHSMTVAARKRGGTDVLEFISQPCGPRKLAKILGKCLKRQQRRVDSACGGVERARGPSYPPTPNELERGPFLNVPILENIGQTKRNVAGNSDPTYVGGLRDPPPPGQMKPPKELDNSHISTTALGFTTTEAESPSQPQQSPSIRVLLVDDNDINLRLLIAFMKKLGCGYAVAQNGQEAFETFKANSSDIRIILMDISMPVMDGLESTRRIREFEKKSLTQSHVKIVALTGIAQDDIQRDAFRSGMDMFLTKPVRMDSLAPMIMGAT